MLLETENMFRFAAIFALLATATAFAPAGRMSARSSSLSMQFEDEIGVLVPTGFWDPLGLAADGDEETFARRRAVELKHGQSHVALLPVRNYNPSNLLASYSFHPNTNYTHHLPVMCAFIATQLLRRPCRHGRCAWLPHPGSDAPPRCH